VCIQFFDKISAVGAIETTDKHPGGFDVRADIDFGDGNQAVLHAKLLSNGLAEDISQ